MATQVTVSGTITNAAGVDAAGTVTFRPSATLRDQAGNIIVGTAPAVATLVSGDFSIVIYATDDVLPASAKYTVTEDITGATKRAFRAVIPSASPTLRYEEIA